jgi:MbtH protein
MSHASPSDGHSIDGDFFQILINAEGQFSLWPAALAVPSGWTPTGPVSSKAVCSAYVDTHWTDMRPISLRQSMPVSASRR